MAEPFTKIIFGTGLFGTEVEDDVVRVDVTKEFPKMCRLAADANNSTITKVDLSGMKFSLEASKNYAFEFHCYTSANAATVGVQFTLTFSGTITAARVVAQLPASSSALGWFTGTSFPMSFNPTASQGTGQALALIEGMVEVNAAGILQLQHGSETASLTTVHRGSWGRAIVVT